jgi:hypothetical protein
LRAWLCLPQGLSIGDVAFLEKQLQQLQPPHLRRQLLHELLHELRAYRDPSGRSPCLRQHLAALDPDSLRDPQVLEQVGKLIAEQHRKRFPPPTEKELISLLSSGRAVRGDEGDEGECRRESGAGGPDRSGPEDVQARLKGALAATRRSAHMHAVHHSSP